RPPRRRCTGRYGRRSPRSPPNPSTHLPTRRCEVDWLTAAQQLRRDGLPGVLVTVLEVRGHAPRDPGTKMVVGASGSWGSVGGGNLEESAIRRARSMIEAGIAGSQSLQTRLTERSANAHGRQCCGGTVRLLLEP